LLADLRQGGYVLYFRHAATDFSQNDEKMKRYEDCADQRNLIDRGRADARESRAAIRQLGIPVERVLASPFCRTVETAQLLFGRAEKMQEVRGGPAVAGRGQTGYAPLKKILATAGSSRREPRRVQPRQTRFTASRPALSRRGRSRRGPSLGSDFPDRRPESASTAGRT